jgi:biopolymer transport protein ExbB
VKLMKRLFLVTNNKVLLQTIKSALVKYQAVKKEGFNRRSCRDYSQRNRRATSLEMPMLQKNMTIISSLVSLGTLLDC